MFSPDPAITATADARMPVRPAVAHTASEKVATLIIKAGCLVPGTGAADGGRAPGAAAVPASDAGSPGRRAGPGPIRPASSAAPVTATANA